MKRLMRTCILLALVLVMCLALCQSALASPITIGFEDQNPATLITNQYATPSGIPEGPTFSTPAAAGFGNWTTGVCGAGHITGAYAHSGSQSLKLDGCATGEFWATSTFFSLGYTTAAVSFYVAEDGTILNGSHDTVVSTAFDLNHNIVEQVTTTLGPQSGPSFQQVQLTSTSDSIAFVAVEHGIVDGNTSSPTGVAEGAGNTFLYLDDLTYDPPASPPAASFALGASPAAVATTEGGSVTVELPINWANNPDPSAYPVTLAASVPPGVTAAFSQNPSSTGSSTLTLTVADSAPIGPTSVTVTGTQGSLGSQVTIPLGISAPFEVVNPPSVTLAPCTPKALNLSVSTGSNFTTPLTISVDTTSQPQVRITGISGPGGPGTVADSSHASVTMTPSGGVATATLDLAVPSGAVPSSAARFVVTAQAASFPAHSNDAGTLAIETGEIDHVYTTGSTFTPPSVTTTWLGQAASSITLVGAGFCPGSTVSIGDPDMPLAPSSIAADGTSLTFSTPIGATTGPITVVPSEHSTIGGPSLTVRTFRNTWGFPIANGDFHTLLSQDMEDELFGKDETNINVFGWLVRKPEAYEYQTITNNHVAGGLCFGFAYSSLEFFDHPADMSQFPTNGGNDPFHIDTGNASTQQSLVDFLVERFSLQFTDQLIPYELNAVLGVHGTNDDLNAIESGLAAGEPVMIGMIHWQGASIAGHTVLAYRTEQLPDGSTAVDVVNSNEPYIPAEESNPAQHDSREFTNSQIIIKDGNWTFPEGQDFAGSGGQPWSGSEADLVVYPHDALPIINGQRPKLPNVFTGAVMVAFGSSGDAVTQLSGTSGQLFAHGALAPQSSWPRGAAPVPAFTSAGGPLQLVAIDPSQAGPLTATVDRHTGGGAMDVRLPGLEASLQAGVHTGQLDKVSVDPHADAISYSSTAPGTPLSGTLLSSAGSTAATAGTSLSDRVVKFDTTVAHASTDTIAFPSGGQLTVAHSGKPASLALTLSSFAADGQPVAVALPAIRLAAGETVQVDPAGWRALAGRPIRLVEKRHGRRTTVVVRGRMLGRRVAAIRSAGIARQAGGHYEARVTLRVGSVAPGAWLSIAASILRGHRTVATATPLSLSGASLHSGSSELALAGTVPHGRYTLLVRVLEAGGGPASGSVLVTRSVHVRL